jgi:hypothetical protein
MKFDKKMIHYYPQYLFVCDEEFHIPKHIELRKLEEFETPKIYNLIEFLDDRCIEVIHQVYGQDFVLFGYDTITSIPT